MMDTTFYLKYIIYLFCINLNERMSFLVDPQQHSFVPGRHSSDNIVIVKKFCHSMCVRKGGKL